MSNEVENWARQQKTGDPVSRSVLVSVANWADPHGGNCYPSIKRIAEDVEVSQRTIQRHLKRLEALGFLKRVERLRDDGSQSSNGFEFPGYEPPLLSYRQPPRQSVTPPRHIGTGRRQIVTGAGDTAVTPNDLNEVKNTLSPDKSGDLPLEPKPIESGKPRATAIPADWAAPSLAELTPLAGKLAAQWPAGAYETIAEAFANHWQSESRAVGRKLDWDKTWAKWITAEHTRVMQAKKFGVSYGSATSKTVGPISLGTPVADQVLQCPRSAAIRSRLEAELGKAKFVSLFDRSAIVIDAKAVRVVAPNPFVSSCIERECGAAVERHARAVVGGAFRAVKYETGALMIVCGKREMAA
jgi:hypothetical protein